MSNGVSAAAVVDILRSTRSPFSFSFISSIPNDTRAVYAFWLGNCCLYVGRSIDVARRFHQHSLGAHNPQLVQYLRAFRRDVEASYAPLADYSVSELHKAEAEAIRLLRPYTNVDLPAFWG